jgi:tRNA 2-selenouridine synthase
MVELPDAARIRLLLEEYGFYAQQVERFCSHLDSLVELCGRQTVARWQALARAGAWPEVFGDLMQRHYDPLYLRSMPRNFAGMQAAHAVSLPDAEPPALAAAARELMGWAG